MPSAPIGITFLPSQDAQAMGPRQGQMEGDLAQAFKILSLRLPQVLGAQALAPKRLLTSPGSAGVNTSASPYAAVFEALLQSALGGGPTPTYGTDRMPQFPGAPANEFMPLSSGPDLLSQFSGTPGGGGGKAPPAFHPIDEPTQKDSQSGGTFAEYPTRGGNPEDIYTRRGRGAY